METIFNATLEAVSLASPTGLSLPDLWKRLAEPAAALGASTLPPTMRRAIWHMVRERHDDIIAAAGPVPQGAEPQQIPWDAPETATHTAAEAANIHLVASPAMQDACLGVYAARLNRFQLSLPQRQTLRILGEAKGRGALQSVLTTALGIENRNYSYVVKNLEERGLVTKCPTVLQKGGGHVTSTNLIVLTKFAPEEMTDPQARFHDGRSGTIDNKNHPGRARDAYLDNDDGGVGGGGGGSSEEEGGSGDDEDNNDFDDLGGSSIQSFDKYGIDAGGTSYNPPASVAGVGGLHMVLDDDVHLRKVTTLLASLHDHSLKEQDLKRELGYIGKRGHRRWRRLRNILERKNCIERFKAREGLAGPIVYIVKLLRAWTGETDEEWLLAALLDPLTGKLNVFGEQVAELTLDRQMLRMLAAAGPDGVTTQQLDTHLKFNIKRNEPRFKELRTRFGENVIEQHINQGKIRLLRFTATPELLATLDSSLQGVSADGGSGGFSGALAPPPGGYVAAVREAIAVGLNDDGTNPLAKYTSERQDGEEEENDLVTALLAAAGVPNAPSTSAAATAAAGAAQEDDDEVDEIREETEDGGDTTNATNTTTGKKNEIYAPSKRRKQPLTEMAKLRRQWIVDRVNREGLLLCSEIGSYLQLTERAVRNNPKAVRPDRKVIQRLIDAALEANELVVLRVTFPGVHGSLSARPHDVLARHGTQADAEFVDKVFAAHREMQKRIRQSSTAVIGQAHEEASREMLPIVPASNTTRGGGGYPGRVTGAADGAATTATNTAAAAGGTAAPTAGAGAAQGPVTADITLKRALDNGLIYARMQRAWKVHELGWKLLDARQGAPSPFVNPSLAAAAAEGKVFLVGHAPVSLLGGRPLDMGVYTDTPEQQAIVLTTDEFWKGLTVEDFVTVLGSRSTDIRLVQEFRAENKKMGDLRRRELIALAGGIESLTTAKGHLTKHLDTLNRMGLICAIVPFGEGGKSLTSAGSASYLFRRKIQYEEPIQLVATVNTSNDGAGPSTATGAGAQPTISMETKLHTFDATSVSGRSAYWLSMEYMVMCSPMAGGLRSRIHQTSLLADCFPFSRAPEAASERSWISRNSIVTEQLNILAERISTMVLPQPGYMSAASLHGGGGGGGGRGKDTTTTTTTGGGAGGVGGRTTIPTTTITKPLDATNQQDSSYEQQQQQQQQQQQNRHVGVADGGSEILTWEGAAALAREYNVPFETVARAVTKVQLHKMRGVIGSSRRLGALGGRSGGGGAAARRRRDRLGFATRRKRRRGGASDDEYSDEENEDAFGNLQLGGGGYGDEDGEGSLTIFKQRKKKWFAEEDTQLLHAWATFLGAHGPDKILRWKYVKGRPHGVLPISCKYRIQVLKSNGLIGPMMMKIVELAGGVHSRRVLREAAKEQEKNGVTGSAAALADGGGAGVAVVGEKRKPGGGGVEEVDGEDAAADEPGAKRARGATAAGGSSINEGEELGTHDDVDATAVAALTANLPPLWSVTDSEDVTALQLVVEEIENVVNSAPNRPKKGTKLPDHLTAGGAAGGGGGKGSGDYGDHYTGGDGVDRGLGERRGRNVLGGLGGRLLGPAARGPVIIARQFTALRQWARTAALARVQGTSRPPMPSISMAMELVKSLLCAVKEREDGGGDSNSAGFDASFSTALTDRFSISEIKEAIAELIRLGHIVVTTNTSHTPNTATNTTTATRASGLALSNRFCVEMQPLFLPGGLFSEAYAAHAELSGPATPATSLNSSSGRPIVKTLLPLAPPPPPSSSSASAAAMAAGEGIVLGFVDQEIPGGAVAAVLSKCILTSSTTTSTRSIGNAAVHAELAASLPRSVRMMSTAGNTAAKAAATAAAVAQAQQLATTTTTPTTTPVAAAPATEAGMEADDEIKENMLRVLTSIKVTATLRGNTNSTSELSPLAKITATDRPSASSAAKAVDGNICIGAPRGQKLTFTDLNGTEHNLQYSSQDEVLYQPCLVATDSKLRAAAEAACKKLFTLKKIGSGGGDGGSDGKCMEQMLKSLRAAGNIGLSPSEFLIRPSSSSPSESTPITKTTTSTAPIGSRCLKTSKEIEKAVGALCRCGLARRVTSYDDIIIVASNTDAYPNQRPHLAFPPPDNGTPLDVALSSLKLPKQGTVQPCIDVPIRPWVDHLGRLRPNLWRALLHRAVSTVLQYPGVSGDVLLQSMRVVNPQHGREVIHVLCAAGIFRAIHQSSSENNKSDAIATKRRSVLAMCFDDELEEEEKGKEEENFDQDVVKTNSNSIYGGTLFPVTSTASNSTQLYDSAWIFFIDPGHWWQAMEVLPPSVLVPV